MESNAQPKQLTIAKIKLKQQEEFTLCGDLLFGHNKNIKFLPGPIDGPSQSDKIWEVIKFGGIYL